MSAIAFIGLVLLFASVVVGLILGALLLLEKWDDRRDAVQRAQANLDYQASLRAWAAYQQEFDQEQRIRQATRRAMEQMVQTARHDRSSGASGRPDNQ